MQRSCGRPPPRRLMSGGDSQASAYAARPWEALYSPKVAARLNGPHADVLTRFRQHLATAPEAIAVCYLDTLLSYRDLDGRSDAFAGFLLARGFAAGDRLFIALQNTPEFIVASLACWKVGAVPVLGNPMYRAPELAKLFADCGPRLILCHEDHAPEVAAAAEGIEVLTTAPAAFQAALSAGATPPPISRSASDLALLLYTSGTTGVPKGAMLTHANLAFVMTASSGWFGLGPTSRILAIAPLFHITGFALHMCLALAVGGSVVLLHRFEPARALDAMLAHRPTFTVGASTAFIALMSVEGASAEHMKSFTAVYSGGAPIPPSLVEQFAARMGQKIHSSYGMTETCAPTHLTPLGRAAPVDPASGALAIGVPIQNVEAMVVDEQGAPCPLGQAGELLVRGPQIMAGYWNKPQESAAALAGGWMHTGDVAVMDAEGWFYLVDRKKDMISASGFKVWPREVEDVLYRHASVREAAVIGVPDAYRGETVKAFVSLKPNASASPEELVAFAREQLAAYKVPRTVEILAELPKTPTGKIQRHVLRQAAG